MRKVAPSASAPPTNTRTVGLSKGLPPRYPPVAPVMARAMRTATKVAEIRVAAGKMIMDNTGSRPPMRKATAEVYAARHGLTMSS